ncbi:MAG: M50 family metallopeptidase [Lactobacillus sp.]|nr:M50 family metallopeptidase [Lactobacillus sp.]
MRTFLDKFIELFKWPVAIYMLLSIPACLMSFKYFYFFSTKFICFWGGFIFFFFTFTVADKSVRTSMQTAAHELTHTFFALLTFHKIDHIRVNPDDSGGSMGFHGEGNWLIIIAPYFFPLFIFFLMIVGEFFIDAGKVGLVFNGALGYLMGYHVDMVSSQIHEKQTDFPKVSFKFCWMFLPAANLTVIGSVLAFNSKGWEGVFLYNKLIYTLNIKNLDYLLELIF